MKKRKCLIFVLLVFFFPFIVIDGFSQALLKIQHHYFYYNGKAPPRVTISSYYKISKKIYISAYYYISPAWSQGLIGFDYAPNPDFMIGMKAGIQSESNTANDFDVLRFSPFIYYRLGKISFAAIYEIGGIKDRSIALLNYNFKESTAGIMFLKKGKFLAIGPRTDMKIPKTPIYIYASALITKDRKFASMFGIYAWFTSLKSKQIELVDPE
ncbi:MAG: hypothetical protein GY834_02145 [Bacteroidetes bacterium]|nr:hypothetical protein [Bacteroidota bacterium]